MEEEAGDAEQSSPHRAEPLASTESDLKRMQEDAAELDSDCPAGALEDLLVVDEEAVQKLSEGLISHYLPQLQTTKQTLQELTQNQVILLETLEQEITKFRDCNSMIDLNSLFTEAKVYHNKLVNIRKEMITIHDKTSKLKKRALKLQQQRQREALEREQQREKEMERERQLIAKPAKRT